MVCRAETLEDELSFEKLLKEEDQGMQVPHYHNAYEIYYLQDGSRGYDFKDKTLKVKKGNLILIKKHVKHQTFITVSKMQVRSEILAFLLFLCLQISKKVEKLLNIIINDLLFSLFLYKLKINKKICRR